MSWGLFKEKLGGLDAVFVDRFNELLTPNRRQALAVAVTNWLRDTARKKAVPDLQERLDGMSKRISIMAETLQFRLKDDEVVVIATGPGEDTLRLLAHGSDWFEPCNGIVSITVSAMRAS